MANNSMPPTLWDFAIAFYAKPGIQSACLTLQNTLGVNVPLLLCCCWVSKHYGVLPNALAKALSQFAQCYTQLSIAPLRTIRTTMKHSLHTQWPIRYTHWEALREQVKALELDAEKLLLQGLEQLVLDSIENDKAIEYTQEEITVLEKNRQACLPLLDTRQRSTEVVWNSIIEKLFSTE